MYLYEIKAGEHFMLQSAEYVRLDEKEEDGSIYCQNVRDKSSGFLARDKQVVKKA